MKIFLRSSTSSGTIALDKLSTDESIHGLKQKLQDQFGIPTENMKLLHKGTELVETEERRVIPDSDGHAVIRILSPSDVEFTGFTTIEI
jgi:hypothetical protein